MATNLTLMQQFLTLFNHILAKWHSFAHSAMDGVDFSKGKITLKKFTLRVWESGPKVIKHMNDIKLEGRIVVSMYQLLCRQSIYFSVPT